MKKVLLLLAFNLVILNSFAQPAWYHGEVDRVWPHDQEGGFIVTFTSDSLDDCKHNYVYFKPTFMQPEQLRNSFALALSAFHSNSKVGVVIDKGGVGEVCYATSIDVRK